MKARDVMVLRAALVVGAASITAAATVAATGPGLGMLAQRKL